MVIRKSNTFPCICSVTKTFLISIRYKNFNSLCTLWFIPKINNYSIITGTERNIYIYIIMTLSLILFLIGILGFVLNRRNLILMIIAIEMMLLAVTLLVLSSSHSFDDNMGQLFSIFIIAVAGAESVIGLSIVVAYYRLRGNISLRT